jgi:5'(3')-deoxyribonucleotidase
VDWLDRHDIPYWDICFMNDKGALGADLYLVDAPENVEELRGLGYKTIVFSNSTNKGMAGPRADTWEDVYRMTLEAREEWRTGTHKLF